MLTFLIPVKHQETVRDWRATMDRMARTLASIAGQTSPNWNGVVAANRHAELPLLPRGFEVAWVDLAAVHLPPFEGPTLKARWPLVQLDKGARVMAALTKANPEGHVMVVDYDDFVSNRLAALVDEGAESPGWYFDSGYVWTGDGSLYRKQEKFYRLCGTSHIVSAERLRRLLDGSEDRVSRLLGSHRFIRNEFAAAGAPLIAAPFPSAVYRIAYEESTKQLQPNYYDAVESLTPDIVEEFGLRAG